MKKIFLYFFIWFNLLASGNVFCQSSDTLSKALSLDKLIEDNTTEDNLPPRLNYHSFTILLGVRNQSSDTVLIPEKLECWYDSGMGFHKPSYPLAAGEHYSIPIHIHPDMITGGRHTFRRVCSFTTIEHGTQNVYRVKIYFELPKYFSLTELGSVDSLRNKGSRMCQFFEIQSEVDSLRIQKIIVGKNQAALFPSKVLKKYQPEKITIITDTKNRRGQWYEMPVQIITNYNTTTTSIRFYKKGKKAW